VLQEIILVCLAIYPSDPTTVGPRAAQLWN